MIKCVERLPSREERVFSTPNYIPLILNVSVTIKSVYVLGGNVGKDSGIP